MAGNYTQLLDIINNPTDHSLPAWDNDNKLIEGLTIKQYLLTIINSLTVGYQFMGVASTDTSGGTPDQNVFYIAGAGTYNGFGSNPITIDAGYIGIIRWNGAWSSEPIKITDVVSVSQNIETGKTELLIGDTPAFIVDNEPEAGSDNLVKSGGVMNAIDEVKSYISDYIALTPESVNANTYATISSDNAVITTGYSGSTVIRYDVSSLIGKKLFISDIRASLPIFYLIADSERNEQIGQYSDENITSISHKEVTIPADAKWLYVNTSSVDSVEVAQMQPVPILPIIETTKEEVEEEVKCLSVENPNAILINKYATSSENNIYIVNVNGCVILKYDVSDLIGKEISITASRFPSYPLYYQFADDSNGVLDAFESESIKIESKKVVVPTGSKWLYLNNDEAKKDGEVKFEANGFDSFVAIPEDELQEPRNKYATSSADNVFIDNRAGSYVYRYDVSNLINTYIYISVKKYPSLPIFYEFASNEGSVVLSYDDTNLSSIDRAKVLVPSSAKWLYVNADIISMNGKVEYVEKQGVSKLYDSIANIDAQNSNFGISHLKGKRCACFGDSITWYDGNIYEFSVPDSPIHGKDDGNMCKGYESYMREMGMNVDNYGLSGATLNLILSQKIKGDVDYSKYDMVTITSGANDTRFLRPVGEIQPIGSTFENTFIGNLQEAIEYILTQNSKIKILLITPINGWIYYPDGFDVSVRSQATGDVMVNPLYVNAIKEVGALYSIPVCDWYYKTGVNILTRPWFINDAEPDTTSQVNPNPLYSLHPTLAGYKRMADILIPCLMNI